MSLSQKLGLSRIPAIESSAMKMLERYDWPGNMRELRNILERAMIISGQGDITEDHIIGVRTGLKSIQTAAVQGSREKIEQTSMSHALNDLKKSLIEAALLKYNGNVTKAAESLGMTRDALKHHIKKTH